MMDEGGFHRWFPVVSSGFPVYRCFPFFSGCPVFQFQVFQWLSSSFPFV